MGWNHQPVMIRPWNLGAKLSGYQVVVAHEKVLASGGTTWVELMGFPKKQLESSRREKAPGFFAFGSRELLVYPECYKSFSMCL